MFKPYVVVFFASDGNWTEICLELSLERMECAGGGIDGVLLVVATTRRTKIGGGSLHLFTDV